MADSFEKIVDKYSDIMFRCAYTYCNNRQDAEDVVQEVFCKYLSKRPRFSNEEHEKAWLLRVTINTSKNYTRSFWRRKVDLVEQDIISLTEEKQDIWNLVRELPEKYRIVIELHYIEGYSIKDIARLLNKNESTIGTRFERAKKKLKEIIEKENENI